jgi:hypothetical protein
MSDEPLAFFRADDPTNGLPVSRDANALTALRIFQNI